MEPLLRFINGTLVLAIRIVPLVCNNGPARETVPAPKRPISRNDPPPPPPGLKLPPVSDTSGLVVSETICPPKNTRMNGTPSVSVSAL